MKSERREVFEETEGNLEELCLPTSMDMSPLRQAVNDSRENYQIDDNEKKIFWESQEENDT